MCYLLIFGYETMVIQLIAVLWHVSVIVVLKFIALHTYHWVLAFRKCTDEMQPWSATFKLKLSKYSRHIISTCI